MTLIILLLFSCGASGGSTDKGSDSAAGDDSGTADTGPGSLRISFEMEADLIPSLETEPVGLFSGSIYAEADATATGPVEGASSLEDIEIAIDLSGTGGPTEALYTTGQLASGIVWVLGCLDLTADGCGDPGDPITIPSENKVIIEASAETPFTVQMNMIRP
jgi:hypothetical protein